MIRTKLAAAMVVAIFIMANPVIAGEMDPTTQPLPPADRLAQKWETQKDKFAGWEQEKDCPGWDQWTHGNNPDTDTLDLPKTLAVVTRAGSWMADDSIKAIAAQYPDDPSVKATMIEAKFTYDNALLKLNTNFNKLLDDAEQILIPKQSDRQGLERLSSRVDAFFDGTAYHDADAARVKALMDRWNTAVPVASVTAPVAMTAPPPATGATKSSIGNLIEHLIELGICCGAAGLVVMKVQPALLANLPGPAATFKLPPNDQLEKIGLGITAFGMIWLLGKLIIGDLLPAGCLTLCGILLASDWLTGKKVLPPKLATTVKSLSIPIACCAVLFGFLHLFLAHWYLF